MPRKSLETFHSKLTLYMLCDGKVVAQCSAEVALYGDSHPPYLTLRQCHYRNSKSSLGHTRTFSGAQNLRRGPIVSMEHFILVLVICT